MRSIAGDRETPKPSLRHFLAKIEPKAIRSPSVAKRFRCCLVFVYAEYYYYYYYYYYYFISDHHLRHLLADGERLGVYFFHRMTQ